MCKGNGRGGRGVSPLWVFYCFSAFLLEFGLVWSVWGNLVVRSAGSVCLVEVCVVTGRPAAKREICFFLWLYLLHCLWQSIRAIVDRKREEKIPAKILRNLEFSEFFQKKKLGNIWVSKVKDFWLFGHFLSIKSRTFSTFETQRIPKFFEINLKFLDFLKLIFNLFKLRNVQSSCRKFLRLTSNVRFFLFWHKCTTVLFFHPSWP